MAFDKFGVVSFTTDAKVSPFVDYLEKGKIMTTKCKKCSNVYFPPKADCPQCMSSDVEWLEITGKGNCPGVSYNRRMAPYPGDIEINRSPQEMAFSNRRIENRRITAVCFLLLQCSHQ